MAAFAQILSQTGILAAIIQRVRFARARMGISDRIDCVVVLLGYALSGEATFQAFYERLSPFACEFLTLFERSPLPSRSALSRWLAALDQSRVESLRTLFQEDLLARAPFADPGGSTDRGEPSWLVADVDGTRKTARQRALPQHESLPSPHRRFEHVCTKGYQGRQRGEVVRTRTVLLQAHTPPFLGTFGGAGNGDDRGELLRATQVLTQDAKQVAIPAENVVLRLDGRSGHAAPLWDVLASGLGVIARSKDDHLLDLAQVQAVLAGPAAIICTHPESPTTRALCDCPNVPLSPAGPLVRLIVTASPTTSASPSVGEQRGESVYELFISTLPSPAFSAQDVLDRSLHRGSFETVLAEEDEEQDADRWVSHTPCGQQFFPILAQWLGKLRLELGQHLAPAVVRTTEWAPAHAVSPAPVREPPPAVASGPAQWAKRSFPGGFPGSAFTLPPDGTRRCPADRPLSAQERRPERDGSLRVWSAGRIGSCRTCSLREQCQDSGSTLKPRRVSAVFWPTACDPLSAPPLPLSPPPPSAPLLWRDWPRRQFRRHWLRLIRRERVTVSWEPSHLPELPLETGETRFTRERRAHYRLSWSQRLARNARPADAPTLCVLFHGLPTRFFETFGTPRQTVAC
ncbi:MAG TPA: hypothetical protein VGF67_30020 [Ktedonobacteraceae bacterium]